MPNSLAKKTSIFFLLAFAMLVLAIVLYFAWSALKAKNSPVNQTQACASVEGQVWIPAGTFTMGSNNTYPDEAWATNTEVQDFWIDKTEVTVKQFAEFVAATDYVTEPEQTKSVELDPSLSAEVIEAAQALNEPGGAVFFPQISQIASNLNWWRWVEGASWRFPRGKDQAESQADHPVTQITHADAAAYAKWAGGRLPTEAEWEYAALAGKKNIDFGPDTPAQVNAWQGAFPIVNTADDGYEGVAPVACFEANSFGLFDMIGNVWEWTADTYLPKHGKSPFSNDKSADNTHAHNALPESGNMHRVIKGGSFLCAENYCRRYRPAARHAHEANLSTNHIGFRVVYDKEPQ